MKPKLSDINLGIIRSGKQNYKDTNFLKSQLRHIGSYVRAGKRIKIIDKILDKVKNVSR